MKKFILTSLALSLFLFSKGQANLPFEIELDTMNIFQLGGFNLMFSDKVMVNGLL